jgi:hypothetical protein
MTSADTEHLTPGARRDVVHERGTVAERAAWLRHARHCDDCARALDLAREGARRARAEQARRADRRIALATVIGLAGVVAAIGIGTWAWSPPPERALVAHLRALPSDLELVTQRDAGAARRADALERGIDAYRRGAHAEAVRALRDSDPIDAPGGMRDLYLASALAHLARFDAASEALDRVADTSVPEGWRDEVTWTRCVTAFATGRILRGDSLLAVLEATGEAGRSRAAALRRDLVARSRPVARR